MSGECDMCENHTIECNCCKCEIDKSIGCNAPGSYIRGRQSLKSPIFIPIRDPMENIDHPSHYFSEGIEAIDVIEAFRLNFNLGNVIKYILRSQGKENYLQDLKKASWYLNREIESKE